MPDDSDRELSRRARRLQSSSGELTARSALWAAGVSLSGLIVTGVVALLLPVGYRFDQNTLHGFTQLNQPRVTPAIDLLMQVGNPPVYALLGVLIAGVALRRHRPRLALAVLAILVASGTTAELLKPLLGGTRPPDWVGVGPPWAIGQASWPSGHATAAMSLSMSAILVTPARLRHLTAVAGALLTIAVSYALIATAAHLPSDVIGAFFVSSLWTALALAALWRSSPSTDPSERPFHERSVFNRRIVSAVLAGGVAAIAVLAFAKPLAIARYLPAHAEFVFGASLIALLVLALTAGLLQMASWPWRSVASLRRSAT